MNQHDEQTGTFSGSARANRDDEPTGTYSGSGTDLPVEAALRLEEVCDAFEAMWRANGRPDIWAAALEMPEALRPVARFRRRPAASDREADKADQAWWDRSAARPSPAAA